MYFLMHIIKNIWFFIIWKIKYLPYKMFYWYRVISELCFLYWCTKNIFFTIISASFRVRASQTESVFEWRLLHLNGREWCGYCGVLSGSCVQWTARSCCSWTHWTSVCIGTARRNAWLYVTSLTYTPTRWDILRTMVVESWFRNKFYNSFCGYLKL